MQNHTMVRLDLIVKKSLRKPLTYNVGYVQITPMNSEFPVRLRDLFSLAF